MTTNPTAPRRFSAAYTRETGRPLPDDAELAALASGPDGDQNPELRAIVAQCTDTELDQMSESGKLPARFNS
jgi:hypothetical protein